MARKHLVLGHVLETTYGGGVNIKTTRKKYAFTVLPEPPAQGSARARVKCSKCHNSYEIRIDSTARYRITTIINRVVFPLLVIAAMIVPGLAGQPNSWIIYFAVAIVAWGFFHYSVGKHGYGRIKRVGKRVGEYAPHELFDPQKSRG